MTVELPTIFMLFLSLGAFYPALVDQVKPVVPEGFGVEVFFSGLNKPTSMTWGPDGNLYISQEAGEIMELMIGGGGRPGRGVMIAKVPPTLLGLVFVDQDLFVSYTGTIAKLKVRNGTAFSIETILSGLPHGRHQNDEIVYGRDGFLYVGIGSTGDRTNGNDPRSATVVRFKPDGRAFEIFAKGLRNPYGLDFDRDGNLFATDNGPDNPPGPDELNLLIEAGHYGFPDYFGMPPNGSGTIGPVTNLQLRSSSDGFAFYYGSEFPAEYVGNAFIAQWGASSGDPNVGKRVVRVPLTRTDHGLLGQEIVFASGFDHPLDVIEDHMGGLLVADHGSGTIYQISYGKEHVTETSTSSTQPSTTTSNVATPTTLEPFPLEFLLLSVAAILGIGLIVLRRTRRKQV